MKYLASICLLFFLPFLLMAQESAAYIDSLKQVVANPPSDSAMLSATYFLYDQIWETEPDRGNQLLRQLIRKGRELKYPYWEGEGYRRLAFTLIYSGDYDSCMISVGRAITLFESSDHPRAKSREIAAILNQGVYYQAASKLEQAISSYELAQKLAIEEENDLYLGKILNNLGVVFKRLDRFEPARRTYQEALVLKQKTKDSLGIANTLYNLGTIEMKLSGPETALSHFELSKAIYLALGDTTQAATIEIGMGAAYYQADSIRKAKDHWMKALSIPGIRPTRSEAISMYIGLGDIALKEEEYATGLEYLLEAKALVNTSTDAWMNNDLKGGLARAYAALGEDSLANQFYRQYQMGVDTLTELKRLEIAQEMSEKYEAELRNAEIERQALLITQQRNRQLLLWLSMLALAVLALGIFMLYRSRLRYQRSEAEAKSLKHQQEIIKMEKEAELNGLRSMIEGQEAERHRVAKDLHDGLGGMLSSIKTRISLGNEPIERAESMLDVACKEVRRIAHNMVPQSLALSGLSGSLEDICGHLQLQGLDCELEISGQPELRLDEHGQSMLLRIVQELTHNIHKHAQAERIFIQLLDQPNQLLLTVEDDGVGFDVTKKKGKDGLGLSSIDSRVNYLKGDILFDSSPGHGTTVTITIPL